MLEKTAAFIRDNKLTEKKLAIGVSGGRDSMCLLHAVLNCDGAEKNNILAVHVNHTLRDTADRDEEFVREFCDRNGVKLIVRSVDVNKKAANSGLTIEQAARELRYGVFYDLVKSGAADVVFTAHHALDNVESILMHMFRGAGVDGLCGIGNAGVIVRPFIGVYPSELDEYAKNNGIQYVTDETNLETDADRNYVRLKVIPAIEERYPGAVKAINALGRECANIRKFLDDSLDETKIEYRSDAVIIKTEALKSPLAERYVRLALKYFTLTDMSRTSINTVISAADFKMGGVAELPHGIIAAREYDGVAIYCERNIALFSGEIPIKAGANYIDGLRVDITKSEKPPKSIKGGAVDFKKLDGAVLRFRRDGDTFKPFGGGTKKLKEYFIDKKIPLRLRDRIPLICRGNEVLIVVGYEISDTVKQTENTRERYVVALRK